MTTIKQQRPTGGCTNCGAEVRTRKANGWVCTDCDLRLTAAKWDSPVKREARRRILDEWRNA